MKREWVTSIFRQCKEAKVRFFFKQWGGVRKDLTGRELYGKTYDDMPPISEVRLEKKSSIPQPQQYTTHAKLIAAKTLEELF